MNNVLKGFFWFFTGVLAVLPLSLKPDMSQIQLWQVSLSSLSSGLASLGAHLGAASKNDKNDKPS
jgi:hypothetical protein